jgi:hypothetical protein
VLGFIFVHFMVSTFYIRFRIRIANAEADPELGKILRMHKLTKIISVPGLKNGMNVYNTE